MTEMKQKKSNAHAAPLGGAVCASSDTGGPSGFAGRRLPAKEREKDIPAPAPPSLPLSRPATVADIAALARMHGPIALNTLVDVAENGSTDASRVSAACALLERGFGKAGQSLEPRGADGGALEAEHYVSPAIAAALAGLKNQDG